MLLLLRVEALIEGFSCVFCLFAGVLTIGGLPAMFFLFSNDRKVLFLPLNHYGFAFEEVVDEQIAYLPLKDVARLVIVPLAVYRTPVTHVLHRVVDRLREGGHVVCVLEDRGYLFEVEYQVVHPNRTREHVLVILESVLVVVVDEGVEGLKSIGLGYPILQDYPPEDLLPLIFRIRALVHQIIVILVGVQQPQNIRIDHHLQDILAIHARNILHLIHLQFF